MRSIFLILFFSISIWCIDRKLEDYKCDCRGIQTFVKHNGYDIANKSDFSFMVAFLFTDTSSQAASKSIKPMASGVLLNEDYILTSAYTAKKIEDFIKTEGNNNLVWAVAGAPSAEQRISNMDKINRKNHFRSIDGNDIKIHPDFNYLYNGDRINDIALIKVRSFILGKSTGVYAACFPNVDDHLYKTTADNRNSKFILATYGTEGDKEEDVDVLRIAKLRPVECLADTHNLGYVNAKCLEYEVGQGCIGGTGAALFMNFQFDSHFTDTYLLMVGLFTNTQVVGKEKRGKEFECGPNHVQRFTTVRAFIRSSKDECISNSEWFWKIIGTRFCQEPYLHSIIRDRTLEPGFKRQVEDADNQLDIYGNAKRKELAKTFLLFISLIPIITVILMYINLVYQKERVKKALKDVNPSEKSPASE